MKKYKQCSQCKKYIIEQNFYVDHRTGKLTTECKECKKKRSQKDRKKSIIIEVDNSNNLLSIILAIQIFNSILCILLLTRIL